MNISLPLPQLGIRDPPKKIKVTSSHFALIPQIKFIIQLQTFTSNWERPLEQLKRKRRKKQKKGRKKIRNLKKIKRNYPQQRQLMTLPRIWETNLKRLYLICYIDNDHVLLIKILK